MKRFSLVLVLALVMALPLSSQAWTRKVQNKQLRDSVVEMYSWRNSLIGNGTIKGMSLDFESETTFGTKTRFGGRVSIPVTNTTNLSLEYNSFEHSGNITKKVTFDKKVYKANAGVNMENSWLDLMGARAISNCDKGFVDFLYGFKFSDTKLSISGTDNTTNTSLNNSWSQKYPIPYIGIGGGSKLGERVWLDGALKFISVNVGGGNVKSYDFDVNVGYKLNSGKKQFGAIQIVNNNEAEWFVTVGYRQFMIDGSFDDDTAKIGYRGPVFGIMGRF